MPKNRVSDPITDQEITFAHMVLSGTMTDRHAAEAAGLNPDTAAYTKAKPRVAAYMLEHRAAMHQQRVQQETEELRRLNASRERVLTRLWELADLSHEDTRNSISAQIKALSLIIAIEGLLPERRSGSSEKKPAMPLPTPQAYQAAWLHQPKTAGPHPSSNLAQNEEAPGVPPSRAAADAPSSRASTQGPDVDASDFIAARGRPVESTRSAPHVPLPAPNMRVPYEGIENPFARRR